VLGLSHDFASVGLKLTWLTPSHLEITYAPPATINLQMLKFAAIDISVRYVPPVNSKAPQ